MLNQGFAEAVRRKIIVENPMLDVRRPKYSKKPRKIRAMTMDEQKAFLEVINTERVTYKEQILISMFTGMRMGEINALSVKDINTNFGFINVDKTIAKGEHNEAFLNNSPKTDKGNSAMRLSPTGYFQRFCAPETPIFKFENPFSALQKQAVFH